VTHEVRLEVTHRSRRSDVVWQTVPNTSSGNRISSVADGRRSRAADD